MGGSLTQHCHENDSEPGQGIEQAALSALTKNRIPDYTVTTCRPMSESKMWKKRQFCQ